MLTLVGCRSRGKRGKRSERGDLSGQARPGEMHAVPPGLVGGDDGDRGASMASEAHRSAGPDWAGKMMLSTVGGRRPERREGVGRPKATVIGSATSACRGLDLCACVRS